jgi:hypothetical protein
MDQKVDQMQLVMSDMAQRDDNLYRAILGAEPIPLTARMGATQQISYYDSLAHMTNDQLVADVQRKIDILEKELYVQARSYEEVLELAKNQEVRMENIPAIQPVLNKDLKRMASGYGWRVDPVYHVRRFHEGMDFSAVEELCRRLDVPYHSVPTEIYKIIFEVRKESNPCALCAKMRRGALHTAAKELGCNKVALGHHFDDVVETFMLNLFFEGRLGCFQPVTYLSRMDIHLIRPMIYMPEKDVRYFANKAGLPTVKSTCPADGATEREEMKKLLATLERENKGLRYRIFGAIQRGGIDGFREVGRMTGMKDYECEE